VKTRILILLTLVCGAIHAQTNVNGGISSNTSWTKSNSPYVILTSVVVDSGITLSIEPGVTVRFADNTSLELNQSSIIALGTSTDSITFTSNSSSPVVGIYSGVNLNGGSMISQFNYCNFKYADFAIQTSHINDTLTIKNSNMVHNNNGISCPYAKLIIDSCKFTGNAAAISGGGAIFNSVISNNQTGISEQGQASVVKNCIVNSNITGISETEGQIINSVIKYNETGLILGYRTTVNNCTVSGGQTGIMTPDNTCPPMWDSIVNSTIDSNAVEGLEMDLSGAIYNCVFRNNAIGLFIPRGTAVIVTKNKIEDNDIGIKLGVLGNTIKCNKICGSTLYNVQDLSPGNYAVQHNYWCTSDTAQISASIFDNHDSTGIGRVYFLPLDSTCYLLNSTEDISISDLFNIYPNPTSGKFSIKYSGTGSMIKGLTIYNGYGDKVYSNQESFTSEIKIDISTLPNGIYFLQMNTPDGSFATKKMIKE
jgi:hypothetical protein